jgi:hypothetical protein
LPSYTEIAAALAQHGSQRKAAAALGCAQSTVSKYVNREQSEPGSLTVNGDEAILVEPPTPRPKLGDIGKLIRERGLDPEEWVVVSTTLNEWDGPLKGGGTQRLKQWKVTLRRAPHLILAAPATHVPRVQMAPPRYVDFEIGSPELIVVEGDHQVPYHDPKLHEASLSALSYIHDHANMTEHVFLGDTGDFPTISKHADHPSATASVNEVIQGTYELLRAKREAAPNARARKLKGNHDWRVEAELLNRAERMYGIRPASVDGVDEIPALSLRRLLHLDALGIELVEDPRGWEHAEVELVPGMYGLVVRHGWIVSAGTAEKSLLKRGRSIIVGHKHSREHVSRWDASVGAERQGVVAGTMSLARDQRFPHFAVADDWLQGFVTVTRWPDGRFNIEHARWDGERLTWRDRSW